MKLNQTVEAVTQRIRQRSQPTRSAYLERLTQTAQRKPGAQRLGCANVAHAFAALPINDKLRVVAERAPNIGIVNAYNDILSAHAPMQHYPEIIKLEARKLGATAQVAGGVPAMCDGVTQGTPGMELSLFSRDVIAMATAVSLSHDVFDAALMIGVCDKIGPGLLIGALHFGHLPTVFVPAGPMTSGLSNNEKSKVREKAAQGLVGRPELLEAESKAYHGAGTCTFYGTANSNQMMMEVMGLHIPGAAFVNPGTKLRQELTRAAVHRLAEIGWDGNDYRPLGRVIDEKAIVNAAIGLLATGGSTNHALHLPAIARAAGIAIDWEDLDRLSAVVPLIARIYPNGSGDVNHFEAAGGMAFTIATLLDAGLLHPDIVTVGGDGLELYARKPKLDGDTLIWENAPPAPLDETMLRPASNPFNPDGGMRLVQGNLGRATFKTSAVDPSRWTIEAPARVFSEQDTVLAAFKAGALNHDVVVVVRFQGPRANGMPELHKLTPSLGVLQDQGFRVALVTDGRMSGASGKVPAAIHVSPEALGGGPLAKLRDGDVVRLCADRGELIALVDDDVWDEREAAVAPPPPLGTGRELFALMRQGADGAERGASAILAAAGL
jgi:phosphogluconate dehydratase